MFWIKSIWFVNKLAKFYILLQHLYFSENSKGKTYYQTSQKNDSVKPKLRMLDKNGIPIPASSASAAFAAFQPPFYNPAGQAGSTWADPRLVQQQFNPASHAQSSSQSTWVNWTLNRFLLGIFNPLLVH
jgi:hypothetical protein